MSHEPILLDTFLTFFEDKVVKTFVDGTVGAGGHAAALLKAHPEIERFYAFDRDEEALAIARQTLAPFQDRVVFIEGNYAEMNQHVMSSVDGIFLDLGVSSMQLDRSEKGFSFNKEGPLDMRMDRSQKLTAAHVVNTFSEKALGEIFRNYGEERRWRRAAHAIVLFRKQKPIKTTLDLVEALKGVLTWGGRGGKKIHPMTLVFQALRIYVNDELKGLEKTLPLAIQLLAPGGRLGVISFHSLEDRIVKHTFQHFARVEKNVHLLTKKPLEPGPEEMRRNPRSRSAKMRFVEKISGEGSNPGLKARDCEGNLAGA